MTITYADTNDFAAFEWLQTNDEYPKERFFISEEVMDAMSYEDAEATFLDMEVADLAHPPYEKFSVVLPVNAYAKLIGGKRLDGFDRKTLAEASASGGVFILHFCGPPKYLGDNGSWEKSKAWVEVKLPDGYSAPLYDSKADFEECDALTGYITTCVYQQLIALLATRNIIKERKENKLARLGIGKSKVRAVTTLRIGVLERGSRDSESDPTRTVRAHWRRGHLRDQRYGPNLGFVKRIFVQPVFVNGDGDYIPRERYNVSTPE